ncbi:MAG: hypothetical protein ACLQVK_06080 [Acidimicrobiales bacterium]
MTSKIGTSRKFGASLVVLLALVAMGAATTAQAASAPPSVYPPQAHPYGHTYSHWAVRFVQWMMAIPTPHNPGRTPPVRTAPKASPARSGTS